MTSSHNFVSKLIVAIDETLEDHQLRHLSEYVFGEVVSPCDGTHILQRAQAQGLVGEVWVVSRLLTKHAGKLEVLRAEAKGAYRNVLQNRLTKRNRFIPGSIYQKGIPQVCRVEIDGSAIGSGFLVGSDLIITNYHVLRSQIDDGTLRDDHRIAFRFDFKEHSVREEDGEVVLPAAVEALVSFSVVNELDYALVRLSVPIGDVRGWFAVDDSLSINLDVCDYACIIQCPDGRPVEIADGPIASRYVLQDQNRVLYAVDTEGGSSGSPCIQRDGRLLALHCGAEVDANQGVFFPAISRHISATTNGTLNLPKLPRATRSSRKESRVGNVDEKPERPERTATPGAPPGCTRSAGVDGWWYYPNQDSPRYRADLLMIMVHGFRSNCLTWDELHLSVQQHLKLECDALLFNYPAGLTEEADLSAAGRQLHSLIKPELDRYQHLLVLAHSAGGLVVKEWLCNDVDEEALHSQISLRRQLSGRRSDDELTPVRDMRLAVLAVRQIINFDVPHFGGDQWKTRFWGGVYEWVLWPLLRSLNVLGMNFGYNRIVRQLEYHGDYVRKLEERYVSLINDLDAVRLPRPLAIEYLAAADNVIAPHVTDYADRSEVDGKTLWVRTDAETATFRRTHTSIRQVNKSYFDIVKSHLRRHLSGWLDGVALAVAWETLCRADDFLVSFRCVQPFGVDNQGKDGPQVAVLSTLNAFARQASNGPAIAVVKGEANVGKSVLARFFARDVCLRYCQLSTEPEHLPMFLLLPQLNISSTDVATLFSGPKANANHAWDLLIRSWCEMASLLVNQSKERFGLPPITISIEWVYRWMHNGQCLLLLESVDEFLDRHHNVIEVADIRRVIQSVVLHPAGAGLNNATRLVSFVRSTLPECESLASAQMRFTVRAPNEEEAFTVYPRLRSELQRVPPALQPLVRSPLILPILGPHIESIPDEQMQSVTAIYDEAFSWLIRDSRLNESFPAISEEQWRDMGSVVAWEFFRSNPGSQSFRNIQSQAIARVQAWSHTPTGVESPEVRSQRARLSRLLPLFADDSILRSLLNRTVFARLGDDPIPGEPEYRGRTYRIPHDNWVQQLAALYLASCTRGSQPDELSFGACTELMFRMAGERLKEFTVSLETLATFMEAASTAPYVLGNFLAMCSIANIRFDGPALDALFTSATPLTGITQLVLATGVGRNALRNDDNFYRNLVITRFQDWIKGENIPAGAEISAIVKSVAWCYLKKLNAEGDIPYPSLWPAIGKAPDPFVVALMCQKEHGRTNISPMNRTLQRAFIEIQNSAIDEVHREITFAHYLYALSVAVYSKGDAEFVRPKLIELLSEGSAVFSRIKAYGVKKLIDILTQCRDISHCRATPSKVVQGD
ncbi:hypothetical protein Psta_4459 [Pirellula staleyi DSM 6068]|uniref:Serine protease n=1 Tax=Pirellula staleyi (strain ATCC 27377 / DSM 6068 / ICPB 4128) TaxID=530564 RepID=D2R618_PIRSD|nr:trypsin-like peptidase domain-containing protein [Pirellula staleyi]ADB19103.1 hypothetical protein Psta_4459 [Pirellula staleyi DSM 6068]